MHAAAARPALLPALLAALAVVGGCGERVATPDDVVVPLFEDVTLHFTPDDPHRYDTVLSDARDNGRAMSTYREMVPPRGARRVTLRLDLRPIPKDLREVQDPWDRAGWVKLVRDDGADVELMRFMTPYGGAVSHEVDVTRYAPLLQGHCVFEVFVDTWTSPGWKVDVALVYSFADRLDALPAWSRGLMFPTGGLKAERPETTATVIVPAGLGRIELTLLSSGHCSDGRGADEFITKDNVVLIDGAEVLRWRPWRDDCDELRHLNPYCKRWSNGYWSSDFERSGWCPGDVVRPMVIDVTGWLPPGEHEVTWRVENIRPEDEEKHHGYWTVSAGVSGWR